MSRKASDKEQIVKQLTQLRRDIRNLPIDLRNNEQYQIMMFADSDIEMAILRVNKLEVSEKE